MENQTMLKTCDVARRLGIDSSTVRRMVQAGKLPAVIISRNIYRFDPATLERYIAARSVGNASA